MIHRAALLSDLQKLLKRLEADLLERSQSTEIPGVGAQLRQEYEEATEANRTAQTFEEWRSDDITQTAAAWVLSCVFVRFLEDNTLIDPPRIAGPGERLQRARDEHELYFRSHPTLNDRDYLIAVFDRLEEFPATRDVFGEHNPIRDIPNWLSGDAAGELLRFFQRIDPNTGALAHDFTDPSWDTRFLGDLYQDLSEEARKRYALLQTPVFVEEFILDRTLDPAIEEFGLAKLGYETRLEPDGRLHPDDRFKMIDPACGSGHFLLGSFARLVDRWRKKEPGTRASVLRTAGARQRSRGRSEPVMRSRSRGSGCCSPRLKDCGVLAARATRRGSRFTSPAATRCCTAVPVATSRRWAGLRRPRVSAGGSGRS